MKNPPKFSITETPTLEELQDFLLNHQEEHDRYAAWLIFEEHFLKEKTPKLKKTFETEYQEFVKEKLASAKTTLSAADQANLSIAAELLSLIRIELTERGIDLGVSQIS